MEKEYVLEVANTIREQLMTLTPLNTILSWGVSKFSATVYKDAFICGGAITLELESYITDRIVFLVNARERVLWGSSLCKFSTQFGLGVKFIIN